MPEWLSALLGSSAFIGAAALAVRETSGALTRRADASVRRMNAETLRSNAESERLLAEARVRESQSRITESDAHLIRITVEAQQGQIGSLTERITVLEGTVAAKDADLRIAREQRDEAHVRIEAMHADFAAIRRSGRLPKDTPPSFARLDHTQPYGVR